MSAKRYALTFSSRLAVPPARAWRWMTSMDGIAREMAPYLRMSAPLGVTDLTSLDPEPGKRLFRSWIKLFGVLPVDYSDLTLVSMEEGVGFVEQSPMGTMRLWRHERRITPDGEGCVLSDVLTFEPRLAGWLTVRIVRALFGHRHRMLRKYLR